MRIRTISNVRFQRNISFWLGRQDKGEEIHVTFLGKEVGVLYGEPVEDESEPGSKVIYLGRGGIPSAFGTRG